MEAEEKRTSGAWENNRVYGTKKMKIDYGTPGCALAVRVDRWVWSGKFGFGAIIYAVILPRA